MSACLCYLPAVSDVVSSYSCFIWSPGGQPAPLGMQWPSLSLKNKPSSMFMRCHPWKSHWGDMYVYRDHFVNASSQWKTTLHCNVVFHWLGAYEKWSLYITVLALKSNHEVVVTWEHFLHYWPFVREIHMAVGSEVSFIFGKSQNTQCSCLCKSH